MSTTKQMESLVWLGPRAMEIQHTTIPEPRSDEVLIAVRAVGICGSELSGYLGQNSLPTERSLMEVQHASEYVSRSIHSSPAVNVIVAVQVLQISVVSDNSSVPIDQEHSHNTLSCPQSNVILFQIIFQRLSPH